MPTSYVNGGSVITIGILFPVLCLIIVCLRFYTRTRLTNVSGLGIDDWLCIPAWLLLAGCGAIMIYGSTQHSIGYHSPPTTNEQDLHTAPPAQVLIEKLEYAFVAPHVLCIAFIRLSIAFLYRRIFRGPKFNVFSWIIIATTIVWAITFTIAHLASCGSHDESLWGTLAELKANCVEIIALLSAIAVSDVALDLILWVMPFFLIWQLKMSTAQKLAVMSVFIVGAFSITAGCLRMVVIISSLDLNPGVERHLLGFTGINDNVGGISMYFFWSFIETGTALIVCCMPLLRPLWKGKIGKHVTNTYRQTTSHFSTRKTGSSMKRIESGRSGLNTDVPKLGFNESGSDDTEMSYLGSEYKMRSNVMVDEEKADISRLRSHQDT